MSLINVLVIFLQSALLDDFAVAGRTCESSARAHQVFACRHHLSTPSAHTRTVRLRIHCIFTSSTCALAQGTTAPPVGTEQRMETPSTEWSARQGCFAQGDMQCPSHAQQRPGFIAHEGHLRGPVLPVPSDTGVRGALLFRSHAQHFLASSAPPNTMTHTGFLVHKAAFAEAGRKV